MVRPLRVRFLTHYYAPEVGAPQARIGFLARSLAEAGHTVTVHTGFPHYPAGTVTAPYRNRPWLVEQDGAVRVVRSAVYPAANRGFARRLTDHSAFAASAVACAGLGGPVDVVVAESPPLFTAAAGVIYAASKRAALVINVADRWPASAVELGALRSRRAIQAAEALERWVYKHADLITAPTAGIVEALTPLPEAARKVRRVWPVIDLKRFNGASPAEPPGHSALQPLQLVYIGTVGIAQGLETLAEASHLVGPGRVQTTIIGDGAARPELQSLLDRREISNVQLRGPVGAADVPDLLRDADAAAVLLRDLPILASALPTKMLEAMAAARPVLLAARGEAADLIEASGAGLTVPPGDPHALAAAIERLYGDPALRRQLGQTGCNFVRAGFGTAPAVEAWETVLEQARKAHAGRRASD